MNPANHYQFQQNARNQQQAVAFNKAALAEPMRAAGVIQSPYNYPAIQPNYPNQNMVNHNGQYYIQQHQQQQQQQQQAQLQHYRRGL